MDQLHNARQLLSQVGWLAEMPNEFANNVLSRCRLFVLERGSTVYRVGEPPDGLYGLAKGTCAMDMAPNESGPNPLHIARPGTWFGESALFPHRDRLRLVTIIATRPTHCLHLPTAEWEQIAENDPSAWRWLGLLSAIHFRNTLGALDDLAIRRPRQRIAAILLRLANARLADNALDPTPVLDVTQKDLAQLSNLSRAALGDHLEEMRRNGLIESSYGQVTILDTAGLRAWVTDERRT